MLTFEKVLEIFADYRTYLEIELTKGKREVTEDDERKRMPCANGIWSVGGRKLE